jgi:hypothetical protein
MAWLNGIFLKYILITVSVYPEYKEKKINKRIPLVLTLSNIIPSLFRENFGHRPFHHWKEIEKSETLAKLFPELRCFAIDIAKDLLLLSCWLTMEHLCVL